MSTIARIAQLYPHLMHLMGRLRSIVHEGMDLTYNQYKMLLTVHDVGSCPLNLLARELGIAMSSASEMVDRLCQVGLVNRELEAGNRRQVRITMTPAGDNVIRSLTAGIIQNYDLLLRRLSEEDQTRLAEAFETIVEILQQLPERQGKDGKQ